MAAWKVAGFFDAQGCNIFSVLVTPKNYTSVASALDAELRKTVDYPSVSLDVATYNLDMTKWFINTTKNWNETIANLPSWKYVWARCVELQEHDAAAILLVKRHGRSLILHVLFLDSYRDPQAAWAAFNEWYNAKPQILACRHDWVWPNTTAAGLQLLPSP